MSEPIDSHPPGSFWRRCRGWLTAALALIVLCAATVCLLLFLRPAPTVTPAQQQTARQALQNPAGAPLHVGNYGDVSGWYSPNAGDYAVQDGMVIFPVQSSGIQLPTPGFAFGDKKTPALVYAPGGDLSARPAPPTDRGWFYGNEWYLYNCQPVMNTPDWWACALLVGGNI